MWVLVIGCSLDQEEERGIRSLYIGSEEEISKGLGITLGVDELGDWCDKVEMVLVMVGYFGGLGEEKGKFP